MLASYGLSRTLTPIIIGLLLKGEHHGPAAGAASGFFARFHALSSAASRRCARGYSTLLDGS